MSTTEVGLDIGLSSLGTTIRCGAPLLLDLNEWPELSEGAGESARGCLTGDEAEEAAALPLLDSGPGLAGRSPGNKMGEPLLCLLTEVQLEVEEVTEEMEERLDGFGGLAITSPPSARRGDEKCCESGSRRAGVAGALVFSCSLYAEVAAVEDDLSEDVLTVDSVSESSSSEARARSGECDDCGEGAR